MAAAKSRDQKLAFLLLFLLPATYGAAGNANTHYRTPFASLPSFDSSGGGTASGSTAFVERRLQAAAGQPYLEEPGRAVVLYTSFGPMRIRLLERLAPRVTALVWALALSRGCSNSYKCAFYR